VFLLIGRDRGSEAQSWATVDGKKIIEKYIGCDKVLAIMFYLLLKL